MSSNINPSITPKNVSELLMNLDADYEIGTLTSRLGSTQIGSQLVDNKSVLGLFQHVDQADTTKNKLFAAISNSGGTQNVIYDVSAGSTSLTGDTVGLKTYFLNYAGDTLRLNGTDTPKAYDSSSWVSTGGVFDLASIPTGYKFPKEFLDRCYMWGKSSSPYTLAYSGVFTSGAFSWTSGNGTVEIEPEDNGGEPTGLGKVPGYILIFKRRSMHRWNYSSAFPEALVNVGAYSQESIVEGNGLCAFYSDSNEDARGFYMTNGGRPIPISHDSTRPIKKWVDAISTSATISGWATDRTFAWSVGDLTVDSVDYTNVVLRYNIKLNQWSARSYPNEFKVFAHYVTGGIHSTVGGDDDGNVWQVDKLGTYSDGSTPINWKLQTMHDNYGTNLLKTMSDRIVLNGENLQGANIFVIPNRMFEERINIGASNVWKKILSILGVNNEVKFNTASIEVSGTTTNARAFLREIEVNNIEGTTNYDQ